MAVLSYLKQDDVTFMTKLLSDITNELCECDCCKKETGCSVFERMYIASNLLYRKVYEELSSYTPGTDDDVTSMDVSYDSGTTTTTYTVHAINMFDDQSCIDWDSIASRINTNSATKRKFVDKSRKKLLSRFYYFLYDKLSTTISAASTDYVALSRDIFGSNPEDVIANCLDECCNQ